MWHILSPLIGAALALAAISAGATTPLGWLNFFVLQWFGIRLARVMATKRELEIVNAVVDPGAATPRGQGFRRVRVQIGWTWLRWVWPLTGWWSTHYRYIARRA